MYARGEVRREDKSEMEKRERRGTRGEKCFIVTVA
jgi:hypothetical protein